MEAIRTEQERARGADDGLDTFLRISRVKQITDSSKTTLWRWIKAGKFPAPIHRDGNTVLWSLRQVRAWQSNIENRQGS